MSKNLQKLAQEYDAARADETAAKKAKDNLRDKIVNALGEESKVELLGFTVEITERQSSSLDEDYLQATLPEEVWEQITSRKIDTNKLLSAIQDGVVDLSTVEAATNRYVELVKKLPHELKYVPLEGKVEASIPFSKKRVTVKGHVEEDDDGSYYITHSIGAEPPFQVSYRHDGITKVLNVRAHKEKKNGRKTDSW